MPGVKLASAVHPLPMANSGWGGPVGIVGRPEVAGVPKPHAEYAVALPGYFDSVGIPLLEGRDFTDGSNAIARHGWPPPGNGDWHLTRDQQVSPRVLACWPTGVSYSRL